MKNQTLFVVGLFCLGMGISMMVFNKELTDIVVDILKGIRNEI